MRLLPGRPVSDASAACSHGSLRLSADAAARRGSPSTLPAPPPAGACLPHAPCRVPHPRGACAGSVHMTVTLGVGGGRDAQVPREAAVCLHGAHVCSRSPPPTGHWPHVTAGTRGKSVPRTPPPPSTGTRPGARGHWPATREAGAVAPDGAQRGTRFPAAGCGRRGRQGPRVQGRRGRPRPPLRGPSVTDCVVLTERRVPEDVLISEDEEMRLVPQRGRHGNDGPAGFGGR